jgi:outer membrane protein OmpA-like peptidoglycan-associated protein
MPALKSYLEKECTYCKARVVSYASPHGNLEDNQNLATNRTASVVKYLKEQLFNLNNQRRSRT